MSNFAFLLRLSFMQVILIGLAMTPVPGICVLLILELAYMAIIIVPYLKHRHLKSLIILIPKVIQSLLILALEIMILVYYNKLQSKEISLTKSQQNILVIFI